MTDPAFRAARHERLRQFFPKFSASLCGGQQIGAGSAQELAAESEFFFAETIGEEAEVADALEARRQRMEEKAAHELAGGKSHDFRFLPALAAVVLPAEGHLAVADIHDAVIGKGDSVGVAAQICEHLLRAAKRLFGIDYPGGFTQGSRYSAKAVRSLSAARK